MKRSSALLWVFLGFLCFQSPAFAATYAVDPDHSSVSFKVRHLFSQVQGNFTVFEGTLDYEPGKPETWKAGAVIQTTSIDTHVAERDKHLRSADFFDTEKFPTIEFKSAGVKDATATSAKLEGLFKLHGVEKPIVLDVQIHGVGKDPWGNVRAGFTAKGKINRKDFGLSWNEVLETGQLLIGEEVEITLEIEGMLKT
ncbi:MAG: YceI family protein [Candidatus Omnitrophica bacterium]|nr:YceI family protein [Candidatus Omnitrophota bacterium]